MLPSEELRPWQRHLGRADSRCRLPSGAPQPRACSPARESGQIGDPELVRDIDLKLSGAFQEEGFVVVAAKSSRVNRQYKKKYRIRNWREYERGLRSRGDVTIWLSEDAIAAWVPPKNGLRGGQRRYSNLAVRTALTLRVVFSLPLRQTEGFLDSLLRLMGLNLKAPDHTLAPEPNRCGAAPDPILRRPDRLDRRFHRAEDSGLRRMERAQAQGIKETPGLAEAAHRGGCRGVHCGGRTHSEQPGRRLHTPCSSRHNRGSHPAFHRRRSLRPQVSLRSTQRGRYRERRDCDSPSSLRGVGGANGRPMGAA